VLLLAVACGGLTMVAGCLGGDDGSPPRKAKASPRALTTCVPWDARGRRVGLVRAGPRSRRSSRRLFASREVIRPGGKLLVALDNRPARRPKEFGAGYDLQRWTGRRWGYDTDYRAPPGTPIPAVGLSVPAGQIGSCVTVKTYPSAIPGRYRARMDEVEAPWVGFRIAGRPIGDPNCPSGDQQACALARQIREIARRLGVALPPP
jgi:hypothetical protein